MRLNDSQIQSFNENGYHLYGPLLSVEEADRMARVSLACVENSHSEHASQRVNKMSHSASGDGIAAAFYQLRCAHLMHPGFESIVRDEGLLDAVESLLGPNLRLVICQGMYKPPQVLSCISCLHAPRHGAPQGGETLDDRTQMH